MKRYEVILSENVSTYIDAVNFEVPEPNTLVFRDAPPRGSIQGRIIAMFTLSNIMGFKERI